VALPVAQPVGCGAASSAACRLWRCMAVSCKSGFIVWFACCVVVVPCVHELLPAQHRGKDSEGAVVSQFEVLPQQVTAAPDGTAKTLSQDGR
jgi:hypothetical protein